jgi:hypothetical protein
MPSGAYPPLFSNTSRDQGASPVVLGYIGASITILVSAIRVGLTLKKQHELRGDDYSFLIGAVWKSDSIVFADFVLTVASSSLLSLAYY